MSSYLTNINWANVLSNNNANDNLLTLKNFIIILVNLFPVSLISQTINHYGLGRVFTNKLANRQLLQ